MTEEEVEKRRISFFFFLNFPIVIFLLSFYCPVSLSLASQPNSPLNCTDTSRLCTSFLAFKPPPPPAAAAASSYSSLLPLILSMFDVTPQDVTQDQNSSPGYVFIRKNCSCQTTTTTTTITTTTTTTTKKYLTNTTYTVRRRRRRHSNNTKEEKGGEEEGNVYSMVSSAYSALASFPPNFNSNRTAKEGAVISLRLLCGCSSGLWNYLMTYVMEAGDSIDSLSSRFGVSMDSIETANRMDGPQGVIVGNVYYIPLNSVPGQPYVDEHISSAPGPAPSTTSYVFTDNPGNHSGKFPYGWVIGSTGVAIVVLAVAILSCISCKSTNSFSHVSRNQSKDTDRPISHKFQILKSSSFCYTSGRYFCCKSTNSKQSAGDTGGHHINIPGGVVGDSFDMEKPIVFSYEEILSSTDEFSDSNLLGQGTYSSVYYGVLRDQEVAVKRMTATKTKEFIAEMKVLCKVHHASLVELIGYAASNNELFLVYEYAQKGSVKSHLHDPQNKVHLSGHTSLSWISRVQIALDAARGLEYIHEHTKDHYVHRDVKTSNILLDNTFRAKISDFGLAKLVVKTADGEASATKVVGTFGYLAPEYLRDGLATTKSDVYAFGVVLFELISGKEAITRAEGTVFTNTERRSLASLMLGVLKKSSNSLDMGSLKEHIDSSLMDLYPHDCVYKMAMLARQCVDEDPILRPDMKQVVISLSHILLSSVEWEAALAGNSQVFSGLVQGR